MKTYRGVAKTLARIQDEATKVLQQVLQQKLTATNR